jgi:hypothetical protein
VRLGPGATPLGLGATDSDFSKDCGRQATTGAGRLLLTIRTKLSERRMSLDLVRDHVVNAHVFVLIDVDGRTGNVYLQNRDTIQQLIDEFGRTHRINRALVPISNEALLPA